MGTSASKPGDAESSPELQVSGWQSPRVGHSANDAVTGRPTTLSNADRQQSVDRRNGNGKKKSKKKKLTRASPSGASRAEQDDDNASADRREYAGGVGSGEGGKIALGKPPATGRCRSTVPGNAKANEEAGDNRVGYGRKGLTPRETKLPPRKGVVTRDAKSSAAKSAAAGLDPARLTYDAMIPFLRSEGWKCADGKGFHTWFFVVPAKETHDGKKRVDYLVSEEEVVRYVLTNKIILNRYTAYDEERPAVDGVAESAADGTPRVQGVAVGTNVRHSGGKSSGGGKRQRGTRGSHGGATGLGKRKTRGESIVVARAVTSAASSKEFRARFGADPASRSAVPPQPTTRFVGRDSNEQHGVHADGRYDTRERITAGSRRRTGFGSSDSPDVALPPPFGMNNTGRAASLRDFSRGVGHQLAQAGGFQSTVSRPGTSAHDAQRQVEWQATQGRPQATIEKAPSWLEIWPKLRREGWHWDYGEQADSSCVYLKPGVSKNGATLDVDMFDSKHSVIAHVLRSTVSSATPHAAEHIVADDGDGDADIDVVEGELSSTAWLAAAAAGQGEGQSARPGVGPAAFVRVQEKKRGGAVFHRHGQGELPFPAVKRGRVEASKKPSKDLRGNTRGEHSREAAGGGDAAAESGDEIEVAASLVMEMLRGEMEESVARRCVESATQQPDAEGVSSGADKLTAHCCEQLLALSESGSGAAGGGSDDASASGHDEGGNLVAGEGALGHGTENGVGGSSDSDAVDVVENHHVPLKHLLPISRGSPGSANADGGVGSTGSPSPSRGGPLAGVGVILAGLAEQPRQEIETKIRHLGAEVVEILGKRGGWRKWLLRQSTRTVANSGVAAETSSAGRASGSGDCNGDPWPSTSSEARTPEPVNSTKPQMRMITVAAPGSDRTPEFQLAVAAGMPIVHPSYVEACSGMEIEVETGRYLLPLGRSGLGNRPLIMPFRSGRGRPFQDKLVILCVDNPMADQTALEKWLFILKVAGAKVQVLDNRGRGGWAGGDVDGVEQSQCTHNAALQLLQQGRVHCVIGSESTAVGDSAARSEIEKAAVEAGTLSGSLEWALQCIAHGRLLFPSAATCPWFPLSFSGVGVADVHVPGSGVHAVIRSTDEPACPFHVHVYNGRRYVAGDYVIIEREESTSDATYGTGAEMRAGVVAAETGDATDTGLPLVARVVSFRKEGSEGSFRREGNETVKVKVAMLGQVEGPMLHQSVGSKASSSAGVGEQEVGEDRLGARVLVLTKREMEATQLHALNDGAIFCLKE